MGSVPSRGFRTPAYVAAALTFLLIIVGGIVRISDSGLGCGPEGSGTEGWPLCGGRVVPLIDMIIEYAHRILAAAVTLLIAGLVVTAWRRHRSDRTLVRTCIASLGLILFQAALGGATVEKGLEEELVAAHLGIAMLQIGILLYIARLASARADDADAGTRLLARRPSATRAVRTLAICAAVATLGTIVAGGYMSASQLHGTPQERASADPHTACGTDFPSCGGSEFLPFGRSRALDIHLTHRAFMYVTVVLVLALFVVVVRARRRLDPESGRTLTAAASATVGVMALQVLLGALNVWLGEHAWLVIVHLAVGALMWVTLFYFTMLVVGAPQPAEAGARHRTSVRPLTAGGEV